MSQTSSTCAENSSKLEVKKRAAKYHEFSTDRKFSPLSQSLFKTIALQCEDDHISIVDRLDRSSSLMDFWNGREAERQALTQRNREFEAAAAFADFAMIRCQKLKATQKVYSFHKMLWNEIVAGLDDENASMKAFWEKPLNDTKYAIEPARPLKA